VIGWPDWEESGVPFWALPLPAASNPLYGWFWMPTFDFWWLYSSPAGFSGWFIALTSLLLVLAGCLVGWLVSRLVRMPASVSVCAPPACKQSAVVSGN
jgi:hypothetical protein